MTETRDRAPKTGSCVCGAVAYEVTGALRPVLACHCVECRKTSGHHVAATQASAADFRLTNEQGLAWYRSSEAAERGFCRNCGSSLFWRRKTDDRVSIMAGTLDGETGLQMSEHLWAGEAGDYYRIADGLPVYETVDPRGYGAAAHPELLEQAAERSDGPSD